MARDEDHSAAMPHPPLLVRWVLRLLLGRENARSVLGDLEELYELRLRRDGPSAAAAWRRRQLAAYPRRLLVDRLRPHLPATRLAVRVGPRPLRTPPRPGGEPMNSLINDLRHSLRSLARTPALAAMIVLTVGLGIGATTAIFSAVQAVLLAPLPYTDPGRLVRIYTDAPPNRWQFSVVDYLALADQQTSFEQVAGYTNTTMTVSHGEAVERLRAKAVTWTYFPLLGIEPFRGRVFQTADGTPGSEPVVVVSHGLWKRFLGGDEAALGKPIRVNEISHIVVGVLPPDVGPLEAGRDLFTIARWEPPQRRGPFFITALGRLRTGTPPAVAAAELAAISRRIFPLWQAGYKDQRATFAAADLKDQVIGDRRSTILIVLGAVAFVLLIASANAANLLFARALQRRRELAVRGALGASRGRLVRHLLAESALLALGSALIGLALASGGVHLLAARGADYIPRATEIALSGPVLWFLGAITLASALLFGLVPALAGTRSQLNRSLSSGGRSATMTVAARRLRQVLVAAQFAVATPLLIASALLLASLVKLQGVDPGFDPRNILTAAVQLPADRYRERVDSLVFWERMRGEVEALPGVVGVAFADGRPPNGVGNVNNFDLEDAPTPPGESEPTAPWVAVSPEYFELMGVSLLAGRGFDERDAAGGAPGVVVVDRAWAERFFPGEDAVGKRLHEGGSPEWTTVVGVVSEVKYAGLDKPEQGTVYWPIAQRASEPPIERASTRFAYVVVRTAVEPMSLLPALRQAVRRLDPALPLAEVATMEELRTGSLEVPRLVSVLIGAFSLTALLLSAVGIYGVMSYFVQQHRKEIGVRLALGGTPAAVRRMVVGRGMLVVTAGVVLGVAAALVLMRWLASLLFGVGTTDPPTYLAVAAGMFALALLACLAPARRAAGVDPMATLREE